MHRPSPVRVAITALALIAAIIDVACFSDRQATTAPVGSLGQCTVAIGPPIIGTTQALVALRNYSFNPDTLHILAGTTVTWVNCEPPGIDSHTSNSETGVWSSGFLAQGATYSHTFSTVGRFNYFCEPHPFMRGVVIVE
jgi:plastocyanin